MEKQLLAAISVSIGSMAVGFNAAYTSTALASMNHENSTLNLTTSQKSWVGSLMPLSALGGSLLGGTIVDPLGRKAVITSCGPPFFIAMILLGSAINEWMLYIGRSIVGICIGLLTLTLPIYLGETIQPDIRGTLGLLPTTIGNGGILICFLIGSFVNWSLLAYVGSTIPLVFFFMMFLAPETPRWFVSRGLYQEAQRSLQWLRGKEDVKIELQSIQDNYESSRSDSNPFVQLFEKKNLKAIFLSIGLMLFQQFSGINAVIFYTVDIFELSGSKIDGHLSTVVVGVVNIFSTLAANALIDKLGRKVLLYISSLFMAVSLFTLGTYFYLLNSSNSESNSTSSKPLVLYLSCLPLVSFMFYVVAFSLGWGPIPWLFMGEALPAKVRGTAASLVTAFNWGCTFIVTKTFPIMIAGLGASGVFFAFGAIMTVGLLYSIFLVPETKGKSLEEIEKQLTN